MFGTLIPVQPAWQEGNHWSYALAQIQMQFLQTFDMNNLVLIDCLSTTSFYCNQDIRSENERLNLITNGVLKTNLTAKVDGFHKRVCFTMNWWLTLSLWETSSQIRLGNRAFVRRTLWIWKYKQTPNGLQVYKPHTSKREFGMLNTVEEYKLFYTNCQVAQAKQASDL